MHRTLLFLTISILFIRLGAISQRPNCAIFQLQYAYDPLLDGGETNFTDSSALLVQRVVLKSGYIDVKSIYTFFDNVKDVYIESNYKESNSFDYGEMSTSRIECLTLVASNGTLYREVVTRDLSYCPDIINFQEFRNLKFLNIYGYDLSLSNIYKCDSLSSFVLGIDSMPFFPLNIGCLKNLQILWLNKNIKHHYEIDFIKKLNSDLKVKYVELNAIIRNRSRTQLLDFNTEILKTSCTQLNHQENTAKTKSRLIEVRDDNGNLRVKGGTDEENRIHGEVEFFNSAGTVIERRFYRHSAPIKTWYKYNNQGELILKMKNTIGGKQKYFVPIYDEFSHNLVVFTPGKEVRAK